MDHLSLVTQHQAKSLRTRTIHSVPDNWIGCILLRRKTYLYVTHTGKRRSGLLVKWRSALRWAIRKHQGLRFLSKFPVANILLESNSRPITKTISREFVAFIYRSGLPTHPRTDLLRNRNVDRKKVAIQKNALQIHRTQDHCVPQRSSSSCIQSIRVHDQRNIGLITSSI